MPPIPHDYCEMKQVINYVFENKKFYINAKCVFWTTFFCNTEERLDLSSICSGCWTSLVTYYFSIYIEHFRNVFDSWDLEVHRKLQRPEGKDELLEFNMN